MSEGHKTSGSSGLSTALTTDSSSIVDLKAEVFKKQQEAKFNKLHGKGSQATSLNEYKSHLKLKSKNKDKVWSKSNAGLTAKEKALAAEADEDLKNIKKSLEIKAKLYEKLHGREIEDQDERFLVNFRKDSDDDEDIFQADEPADESEEWVEYVDALGRSRIAMKKDLPALRANDKDLEGSIRQPEPSGSNISGTDEPQMLSEDVRREMLRQKWEKEEEENLKKTKIHYKDVLFDEARTHGAAFYNFSRDESMRQEELENLKTMHHETEKLRDQRNKVKAKRKAAMELRLKKVRDRKRLKMGLPIKESYDPKEKEDSDQEEAVPEKSIEKSVAEGLREMRQMQEIKKAAGPREWDIGKEGADEAFKNLLGYRKETRVYSQQEWVDKERKKRGQEFAPPTNYEKRKLEKPNESRKREFAPPSSYVEAPQAPPYNKPPPPKGVDVSIPPPKIIPRQSKPAPPMSSKSRLEAHKEMMSQWGGSGGSSSEKQRGAGAEIAPPCSMDYYSSIKPSKVPPFASKSSMSESFDAGISNQLKFFRKASEGSKEQESDSDSD